MKCAIDIGCSVLALNIVLIPIASMAETVSSESIIAEQTMTIFDPVERVNMVSVEKNGSTLLSDDFR